MVAGRVLEKERARELVMANSNGLLTELDQGPQALTPVEAHWFSPIITNGDGNTVVTDPFTTNYNNGNAPWNVTLTDTDINNESASSSVPIASYSTGYNFHIASVTLADGNKDIFYSSASGTYPQSSAVDLNVQTVNSQGSPIGSPVTLQSGLEDVRQFRVGSAALGGNSFVLTWAQAIPDSAGGSTETVHYQGYTASGLPISGDNGTLDSFSDNTTTGESYGFITLQSANESNPSFVYLRGSTDNGRYPNNVGVKYETVATSGQPSSSLTLLTPPYPSDATSPDLLNFNEERLTPTSSNSNDLAVIMRYSYADATGTTQQAIDVKTLNAESGAGTDHSIALSNGDTDSDLTSTVLANGNLAVGYGNGSDDPYQVQVFDPNGNKVGSPLVLPSDEAGFQLSSNDAGQLVVEWTANTGSGQQLDYDIYNVSGLGTPPSALSVGFDTTSAGFVNGRTPILEGTIADPSGTASVELYDGDPASGGTDLGAATVNGDGTWTFQGNIGPGDFAAINAVAMDAQGSTASATAPYELVTGVTGQPYRAIEYDYTSDGSYSYTEFGRNGNEVASSIDNGDNTHSAEAFVSGQVLSSIQNDVMTGDGYSERFVFNPHFGHDEITNFVVGGAGHDVVDLTGTRFSSIQQVLNHTNMVDGSATIHLNPQDSITLDGVSKTQIKSYTQDLVLA